MWPMHMPPCAALRLRGSHTNHAGACAQIIGVGASVVGDMSSRPNWGLNELDFVFATLVVSQLYSSKLCPAPALRSAVVLMGGPGGGGRTARGH